MLLGMHEILFCSIYPDITCIAVIIRLSLYHTFSKSIIIVLLHLIDGIFLKTTTNWADERNELNSMLHIIKIGNMIFDVIIIISIQSLVYISIFELLVLYQSYLILRYMEEESTSFKYFPFEG